MAYIFDPIRNTFVDDEDTSLGNKLALNDTSEEIIRQIDEQFGPGTVFPASELPVPENPYKDFEDRNPMAGIEDETREYYLKYLEDRPEGSKGKPIPLKTFAPEFIKENAADGGMIRQNFADNPLKNFNTTTESTDFFVKKFGKVVLDNIALEKFGVDFNTAANQEDPKKTFGNFKKRLVKFEDFIKENNRVPTETEARKIGRIQRDKTITGTGTKEVT